jgi:hypothetical protein
VHELLEEEAAARLRAQIALASIIRGCPNINWRRLALVFDPCLRPHTTILPRISSTSPARHVAIAMDNHQTARRMDIIITTLLPSEILGRQDVANSTDRYCEPPSIISRSIFFLLKGSLQLKLLLQSQ